MKEWSEPIVKLVGDTRRIVENNKSIKKCVFNRIDELLKENRTENITEKTKRKSRNKINRRTRRIIR